MTDDVYGDDSFGAGITRIVEDAWRAIAGEPGAGALIDPEIERAVAFHLYGTPRRLPDPDSKNPRDRSRKKTTGERDSTTPRHVAEFLSDFHAYLFAARANRMEEVLRYAGRHSRGNLRYKLSEAVRRFLKERVAAHAVSGMIDRLRGSFAKAFESDHELVRVKTNIRGRSSMHSKYWSQCERSATQLDEIRSRIDVWAGLTSAFDAILADPTIRPLPIGDTDRLTQIYPDEALATMAGVICSSLTVSLPGIGDVTFIPQEELNGALRDLVEWQFPELLSMSANESPSAEVDGDPGVLRSALEGLAAPEVAPPFDRFDLLGPEEGAAAAAAVLDVMEELTFNMPATTTRRRSGAKLRHLIRLRASGLSPREAATEWNCHPLAARGPRALSFETAMKMHPCTPGQVPSEPSPVGRRCVALLEAFAQGPGALDGGDAPTHTSIRNWYRDDFMPLWRRENSGLGETQTYRTATWFLDLLFLEVGHASPALVDADHALLLDLLCVDEADESLQSEVEEIQKQSREAERSKRNALRETSRNASRRLVIVKSNADVRISLVAARGLLQSASRRRVASELGLDEESVQRLCSANTLEVEDFLNGTPLREPVVNAGHRLFVEVAAMHLGGRDRAGIAGDLGVPLAVVGTLAAAAQEVVDREISKKRTLPDYMRGDVGSTVAEQLEDWLTDAS